jgi:hypothetical protein
MRSEGWSRLYVAVDGAYHKIGVSGNPERRMKEIYYPNRSAGFPRPIVRHHWYLGKHAMVAEQYVKTLLRDSSVKRTTEWFAVSEAEMLIAVIAALDSMRGWKQAAAYREFGQSGRPPGNPGGSRKS